MRSIAGALALVMVLLAPAASRAEESLTQRDARGPVTVVATLLPAEAPGAPVKVKIALDTHSVALDTISFDRSVVLRQADGTDMAPTAVEVSGGGHHRQAVLTFPPTEAEGAMRVVVKNVGGVPERVFTWQRPSRR